MASRLFPSSWGAPEPPPAKLSEPAVRNRDGSWRYDEESRFTDKAQRCHAHVKGRKGGSRYNAYAVCNASIGKQGAYKKYQ